MSLIRLENLTKHFPRKSGMWGGATGVVRAVEDVSFDIANGETLGLVGESGSGKSTTGRLMLRLIEATAGRCFYNGRDVFALPKNEMRALRREMQIVFQDPYGAFNPRMTVSGIVGEALLLRGITGRAERDREVTRYLEMVQMPTNILARYPHEFSGGQRQRISIARALAVDPKFIVADEPVSALDVSTQAEIVNLLLDLQQRLSLTMLFISHDLSVVRVVCDRIAVMFGGRLLELADGPALFANPLQPYTRELLAAVPVPDPQQARRHQSGSTPVNGASHAAPENFLLPAASGSAPDGKSAAATAQQVQGCPYAGRCPFTMDICRQEMPPLVDYAPRLDENRPHLAACHRVEQNIESTAKGNTGSTHKTPVLS
ncbi:MAG TPA: ATP-binding cassette domain-containing protein [Abditibacteriaceae bacterium]|nr:ATP-binding cassette domain-containing protein [Abditibacteriaceae bacterium]